MQGVQFVCELATPQTYQLTPTEVALLKGQNNIWRLGTAAGSPPFIDSQKKTLGLIRLGGSFALPFKKYPDGQFLGPIVIDISAVLHLPVFASVQFSRDFRILLLQYL